MTVTASKYSPKNLFLRTKWRPNWISFDYINLNSVWFIITQRKLFIRSYTFQIERYEKIFSKNIQNILRKIFFWVPNDDSRRYFIIEGFASGNKLWMSFTGPGQRQVIELPSIVTWIQCVIVVRLLKESTVNVTLNGNR